MRANFKFKIIILLAGEQYDNTGSNSYSVYSPLPFLGVDPDAEYDPVVSFTIQLTLSTTATDGIIFFTQNYPGILWPLTEYFAAFFENGYIKFSVATSLHVGKQDNTLLNKVKGKQNVIVEEIKLTDKKTVTDKTNGIVPIICL